MDNLKIGNYIKELRIKNNLMQTELADQLCISFQAVSKWELGETVPDTAILLGIKH
ncbi:MAG: helix-turn-helix transcriptional regulator [Clostridia bacterium]|nr:helix-turn-helix transcriptional regulator [Clostridia bacterium]